MNCIIYIFLVKKSLGKYCKKKEKRGFFLLLNIKLKKYIFIIVVVFLNCKIYGFLLRVLDFSVELIRLFGEYVFDFFFVFYIYL